MEKISISKYFLKFFEIADCHNYKILDDSSRNILKKGDDVHYYHDLPDRRESPDWQGNSWYRFKSPAGTKLSEDPLPIWSCTSYYPSWIKAKHPIVPGQEISTTACFMDHRGNNCKWSKMIKVKNCVQFYVYFLYKVGAGERYCPI